MLETLLIVLLVLFAIVLSIVGGAAMQPAGFRNLSPASSSRASRRES